MPAMLQPKQGRKIRFAVLGKPDALQDKQSALLKRISKVLEYQDVRLVR